MPAFASPKTPTVSVTVPVPSPMQQPQAAAQPAANGSVGAAQIAPASPPPPPATPPKPADRFRRRPLGRPHAVVLPYAAGETTAKPTKMRRTGRVVKMGRVGGEEGFYSGVMANHADHTPSLVFADYLEDGGDAETAKAIRDEASNGPRPAPPHPKTKVGDYWGRIVRPLAESHPNPTVRALARNLLAANALADANYRDAVGFRAGDASAAEHARRRLSDLLHAAESDRVAAVRLDPDAVGLEANYWTPQQIKRSPEGHALRAAFDAALRLNPASSAVNAVFSRGKLHLFDRRGRLIGSHADADAVSHAVAPDANYTRVRRAADAE